MYDNFLFLDRGNTMQASEAFVQQRVSATLGYAHTRQTLVASLNDRVDMTNTIN